MFSIILPVYNVEDYLRECLDSIQNQTFSNFEAICVNDGSTDGSLEILNEYAQKDNHFVVLSQENQGQGIARNKAIDIAKGEYILFVDPDDWIEIDALEILNKKFKESQAEIIHFDYVVFNKRRSRIRSFQKLAKKKLKLKLKNNSYYSWYKFKGNSRLNNYVHAVWSKAYSTKFIKDNHIKCAPNKHGEDHIFSLRSLLLANKIYYTNELRYHYRQRPNSAVNKTSHDNFCVFENIKLLNEFLIVNNLYENFKQDYSNYIVNIIAYHFSNIPINDNEIYLQKAKEILTCEEFKLFKKKIKKGFDGFENLFALKNRRINGQKFKVINILGFEFKFKVKI